MPAAPRTLPVVRIVSPALASANNGNAHTAARWRDFLAPVAICDVSLSWNGEPTDVLIALHARRSADSIARFRSEHADRPIALVLTGTDLYRDIEDDPRAQHSLECASAIVVLQDEGLLRLAEPDRAKARVIVQSASALVAKVPEAARAEFIAVGHLREEKDPLTLLRAMLTAGSDIRLAHVGAALDRSLGAEAERTMRACANYRWLGALTHAAARRHIARSRALVHPSRLEGGANVVIEAVRSRVPVLASCIDGNIGLLGRDYDGYFAAGDSVGLARLMRRFSADASFAAHLAAQCAAREPLFRPGAERAAVRALVFGLLATRVSSGLRE
ncbi:MAG: selenoneine biosynthesis selenosugar synthase SenB [Caldimonas sp.]